jgi:hypothetical protein
MSTYVLIRYPLLCSQEAEKPDNPLASENASLKLPSLPAPRPHASAALLPALLLATLHYPSRRRGISWPPSGGGMRLVMEGQAFFRRYPTGGSRLHDHVISLPNRKDLIADATLNKRAHANRDDLLKPGVLRRTRLEIRSDH